jgi:hypothetical protein
MCVSNSVFVADDLPGFPRPDIGPKKEVFARHREWVNKEQLHVVRAK